MNNRFCPNCGTLLRPDDTCPNCGASFGQATGEQQTSGGFDLKGAGMSVLDCMKAFFSKEPHKAVDAVVKSHFMWIFFGVVNVVCAALGTSVVFSNAVDWAIEKVIGLDSFMLSNLISKDINTSGASIFFFSRMSARNSRAERGSLPSYSRFALRAVRIKFVMLTPGISTGY